MYFDMIHIVPGAVVIATIIGAVDIKNSDFSENEARTGGRIIILDYDNDNDYYSKRP